MVGIEVPFNAAITSETAFHHKAGMHTNAMLNDPSTYEIFDPARFGRERTLMTGHRLVGRHAIAHRASTLGLTLTDHEIRTLTGEVKRRADAGPLSNQELDDLLRTTPPTPTLPHKRGGRLSPLQGGGNLEDNNGHAD
jgi:homocitrate synthase